MNAILFGIVAGLAVGALSVGLMLPLDLPDKTVALLGAFTDRFASGFLVPLVGFPWPGWARGALVGLLVSLPSAIISKTHLPILGHGTPGRSCHRLVVGAAGEMANRRAE